MIGIVRKGVHRRAVSSQDPNTERHPDVAQLCGTTVARRARVRRWRAGELVTRLHVRRLPRKMRGKAGKMPAIPGERRVFR